MKRRPSTSVVVDDNDNDDDNINSSSKEPLPWHRGWVDEHLLPLMCVFVGGVLAGCVLAPASTVGADTQPMMPVVCDRASSAAWQLLMSDDTLYYSPGIAELIQHAGRGDTEAVLRVLDAYGHARVKVAVASAREHHRMLADKRGSDFVMFCVRLNFVFVFVLLGLAWRRALLLPSPRRNRSTPDSDANDNSNTNDDVVVSHDTLRKVLLSQQQQ